MGGEKKGGQTAWGAREKKEKGRGGWEKERLCDS